MTVMPDRQDINEARQRLTTWWTGGDIGRPAVQMTCPHPGPPADIPEPAVPEGVRAPRYTVKDFDFRVAYPQKHLASQLYLGEAVPSVSPDLAPNCLALYLGCKGVEGEGTVWCEPCIETPQTARFQVDFEKNLYWDFTMRLGKEYVRLAPGRWLVGFPDLIEGLDTLAAMRDTQTLLADLIERPDWVKDALQQTTREYFHCYDRLYELIQDDVGGSVFWIWAPGRLSKLQCDFSAMISADMYREFMVPVLEEMTEKLDYSLYHFDGPGALQHHEALMGLEKLTMLQWTPGAGAVPGTDDPHWFDLYHRTIDAGKKVMIGGLSGDKVEEFKKEFGQGFKQFTFSARAASPEKAGEYLRACEV